MLPMTDPQSPQAPRRPTTGRGNRLLATSLPWHADSVGEARTKVRALTMQQGLPAECVRAAALLASELVSNAVEHGAPPLQLRVLTTGTGLRLEVDDASPTAPSLLGVPATAATGRGLTIVDAVSSAWGHYSTVSGKCVWCDIATPAG